MPDILIYYKGPLYFTFRNFFGSLETLLFYTESRDACYACKIFSYNQRVDGWHYLPITALQIYTRCIQTGSIQARNKNKLTSCTCPLVQASHISLSEYAVHETQNLQDLGPAVKISHARPISRFASQATKTGAVFASTNFPRTCRSQQNTKCWLHGCMQQALPAFDRLALATITCYRCKDLAPA